MSLDVYLSSKPKEVPCICECGNAHTKMQAEGYYDANITHNLGGMADKAGLYYPLWRPEEKGWKYAKDIILVIEKGLKKLKEKPEHYKTFNPDNGWGDYDGLVEFAESYLAACKEHPDAEIEVSR